jgi:hypothetical protein
MPTPAVQAMPRIGVAVGALVCGVIGATKPVFDIWGDTVSSIHCTALHCTALHYTALQTGERSQQDGFHRPSGLHPGAGHICYQWKEKCYNQVEI